MLVDHHLHDADDMIGVAAFVRGVGRMAAILATVVDFQWLSFW
jgi:hypothetical protein